MTIDKRFLTRALAVLVALILLAYLVVLVKITVVKGTTVARILQNLTAGRAPLRAVNLIPFETVLTYAGYRESMPFLRWFSNIFGNMLIFVPLGLYLPTVFPGMRRFLRTLLAVVLVSASLEALQYLLGTGSTDIDDLWLNALGGSLGYLLFSLVTRLTAAQVPALAWTVALSACFAAAGYATAYREFGVYLGLATFKEEVRGDQQIPGRAPEAVGIVNGSRADRLILSVISRSPGSGPPPAAGAGRTGDADEIEVRVGPGTRFYDRQTSDQAHTQATNYVPYTPRTPADVPKDVQAHVWGRWEAGHLEADVVWTLRPRAVNMAAPAPAFSTVVAPGGLALPKAAPALTGHTGSTASQKVPFKGVTGDEVTVYKTRTWQQGQSIFAVGTTDQARFLLSPRTVFYRQRILRGGREVYLTAGSREDIVAGRTVRVWGSEVDGALVADAVCIITTERR